MSIQEAYKKKAEAELEIAQARLGEFQAKAKSFTDDVRLKYAEQINNLEQGIETAKLKLKELGDAGEDAWRNLRAV